MGEVGLRNATLSVIWAGAGNGTSGLPESVDWMRVIDLVKRNRLSAIGLRGMQILDSAGLLVDGKAIDRIQKKRWIGIVVKSYEQKNLRYMSSLTSLARFCNQHSLKMMILKGYGLSLNYPDPMLRPCGDIDIWMFGKYRELDEALLSELGIKVDNSLHHHTMFKWEGFNVENHYDIVNVHSQGNSAAIEEIFKDLAMDDSFSTEIGGEKVYLPSPDLHALFQIRHIMGHFAAEEVEMRQILDWAFFVQKNHDKINWDWLTGVFRQFRMTDFFSIVNSICVEDLGFDKSLFPEYSVDGDLKNRVLNEILSPEFHEEEPKSLLPRILFKYRRWQANSWKQKLCFPENRFKSFFRSVWSHMLKPKKI